MRIGILSDSHGKHEMVRRAMQWFDGQNVTHFIHCGDVGGTAVFDEMVSGCCHFVWGNCDIDDAGTIAYLKTVGIALPTEVPLRLKLGGKRLAVFHGHEPEANHMERLANVDYVFHGHSHRRRDERVGSLRIINPGALFRARPASVAVLDLQTDVLTFHEVSLDR